MRLSSATPISLEITMPALSLGQMRYVEFGEGSFGTENGSRVLHSSWIMSVSIRVPMRGSVATDFSFARSEPKRLVVQVAKKGRRASSRVCMVAVAQASRKDAISDGFMHAALNIFLVRTQLMVHTWDLPTIFLPTLLEPDHLQEWPSRSRCAEDPTEDTQKLDKT